jgi:hypothetical protein
VKHVTTIVGGKVSIESKRERKLLARACLNVAKVDDLIADPRLPPWSHREINFSRAQVPHGVFVQDLFKPSIKQEGDPVVEKPPDEPLVAMVSSPTTMALSPASAGPSQTSTKILDWCVPFI